MRPLLIAVVFAAFGCSSAFAQGPMGMTTPALSATTPLGGDPGTPVAGTGIPMGAAVPSSPIVSALPSYPTGAGSATCSTLGTPSAQMYGSPSSYDGGGVTLGGATTAATASTVAMATPATTALSGISSTSGLSITSGLATTAGSSGMCGSGSSSVASTTASTSSSTATARAGIPLDSTEISNLGVSSAASVPLPGLSPIVGMAGQIATVPTTMPTTSAVSPASTASTATTSNVP